MVSNKIIKNSIIFGTSIYTLILVGLGGVIAYNGASLETVTKKTESRTELLKLEFLKKNLKSLF